ncbi:MAG TPA: porin [Candidatus Sulfotelmatobacter sp.]|jgi:predicted porin|nr:porin [Candidatus Sulfotelmatobacter sp.]
MKKVLFAGVAAVAFGAAAAQAAEPVKLSLGGFAAQWAGYAQNSSSTNTVNFDTQDDIRLQFTGATKLDNGIGVSVEVDTMGTQGTNSHTASGSNKNNYKSFVAVSSVIGTVELGEQDNVGALIHNSSPNVDGFIGGQDGNFSNWVIWNSGYKETYGRTYAGDDRSSNKVIYITPSFYGLAAGFSYTPSIKNSDTGHTTIVSNADYNGGLAGDLYVYGFAYNNTFGDVTVKADVGAGNANVANLRVYQGGLNVGYKGFTVGGSYLKRDIDTNKDGSVSGTGGLGATGAYLAEAAHVGTSWDAGVSYVTGPYGVSLSYFHGTSANAGGYTGSSTYSYDKTSVWALGGAYDLGPGVKLTESIFTANYDGSSEATTTSGWGAVTGVIVNF